MKFIGMKLLVAALALSVALPCFAEDDDAKAGDEKTEKSEKPGEKSGEKPAKKKSPSELGEIRDIIDKLEYPELQVVPRASQRIEIEAKDEDGSWFITHWPMMVSGLSTAYVGTLGKSGLRDDLGASQTKDSTTVSTVTTFVGVGWFSAGLLIGLQRPYRNGLNQINKFPKNGERNVLLRERLAEEALEKPYRLMSALKWANVLTNFTMSAVMGLYLTDQGRVMAGVAMALAFLPAAFEDHTIMVYEKHLEYKKKIYGPLSSAGIGYDPSGKNFYPTANLTWQF